MRARRWPGRRARAVRGASGMVTTLSPLRVMTSVQCPRFRPGCPPWSRAAQGRAFTRSGSADLARRPDSEHGQQSSHQDPTEPRGGGHHFGPQPPAARCRVSQVRRRMQESREDRAPSRAQGRTSPKVTAGNCLSRQEVVLLLGLVPAWSLAGCRIGHPVSGGEVSDGRRSDCRGRAASRSWQPW